MVKYLKKNKSKVVEIQGHADPSESSVSSMGKRRSALFRLALTKAGVPSNQLKTISLGITKPASKDDASKNQRVTFKVL